MNAFIGVTDGDWHRMLSLEPSLDEVNFWQPSGSSSFRALPPGGLFLFKLHSPRNFIVGGGWFAHFSLLPLRMAWTTFGRANGATSFEEMRLRIEKYRRTAADRSGNYTIGCILLEQPFFLPESSWIAVPSDWSRNIVRGKGYDLAREPGRTLWLKLQAALSGMPRQVHEPTAEAPAERYGEPTLVMPRLGQGSFRVLVTDAYQRRCTVTGERVLPALEAAHIKPYSLGGEHVIQNGLLLRRDLHALFDGGYVTITPDHRFEVSRRIKEEFENGRDYYKLRGQRIRPPEPSYPGPSPDLLRWHNEARFLL